MEQTRRDELSDLDRMTVPMMVKVFIFYESLPATDVNKLISSLVEGVHNATRQFPFMAGKVVVDQSGKPHIRTLLGTSVQCKVQHLSLTEHISFSQLASHSFAPADIDETRILPQWTVDRKPVCAFQLSVIDGGLILGFTMDHRVGDWVSLNAFLSLVCRGSQAYQDDLAMPVYTPDLNKSPYSSQFMDARVSQSELLSKCPGYYVIDLKTMSPPKSPPAFQTCIYRITSTAAQQLKRRCTTLEGVKYVSSYDCISAILWQAITRARVWLCSKKKAAQSRLLHPIDLRCRDPEKITSEKYFGNGVVPSQVGPIDIDLLLSGQGLAIAASMIRKSINSISMSSIGDLTALSKSLGPTEMLGYHADFHDMDILMNNWFSGKAEDYSLGNGMVPHAFRPHRPITGACCLILPDFSRGGPKAYEVFVQLQEEEHKLLQQDTEFLGFCEVLT